MRQPAAILATGGNLFNECVDTTGRNFHLRPAAGKAGGEKTDG